MPSQRTAGAAPGADTPGSARDAQTLDPFLAMERRMNRMMQNMYNMQKAMMSDFGAIRGFSDSVLPLQGTQPLPALEDADESSGRQEVRRDHATTALSTPRREGALGFPGLGDLSSSMSHMSVDVQG